MSTSSNDSKDINRLVGDFMDLHESWEDDPARFAWEPVRALARAGAQAYNEGNGQSFHVLAFDGYTHGEFHERLLGYLLEAGFDPFRIVQAAAGAHFIPVFGHDGLAAAARHNPVAARMRATLQEVARRCLEPADHTMNPEQLRRIVMLCHDSIPNDLLLRIAPEFAS